MSLRILLPKQSTPPTIAPTTAKAWARRQNAKRLAEVDRYIDALWPLAQRYRVDPGGAFAQWDLETGSGSSDDWSKRLNPAGLGHTDDVAAGNAFTTPEEAAAAQVVHLLAYARPTILHRVPPSTLRADRRLAEVFWSGFAGRAATYRDLQSKWATDPLYGMKVQSRHGLIAAQLAEPKPTPAPANKAPLPAIAATWATANWSPRPPGVLPVAIVWHITDDLSFANVRSWFQNPVSQASAHVVIDRDGSIHQFVSSTRAAWTNGDYSYGGTVVSRRDLPALNAVIERCQAHPGETPNHHTLTAECIGTPETGITALQFAACVDIGSYWRDRYSIKPNRGHMWRHADINPRDRAYCPGPNFPLASLIERLGGDPKDLSA